VNGAVSRRIIAPVGDSPRGWTLAAQLLAVYTVGGTLLSLPFTGSLWPREVPDVRPYVAGAVGVCAVLTVAVFQRARRLAVGAAVLIPIVVAAAWYAYEIRWNQNLHDAAGGGDPAAIAMVLRGRSEGWLWSIGANTVLGSLAALLCAFYWMWRLDRESE
jgi:hypothetical protein